ncbi:MAG: ATPase domain-containing protein [Candidatus Atabeyarchaeum deiterrae]
MSREVTSSGIPSLDKIIGGGFNRGDAILVAGQPGAGKSTLGAQFIYNGAKHYSEPGVYVTFVEPSTKLKRDMLQFHWDFNMLEQEGKATVIDLVQMIGEKAVYVNLDAMMTAIHSLGAKRLVIDSLSALMAFIHTKSEARSLIGTLTKFLENSKCTTLLIQEVPWGVKQIGMGFEEFMTDGLIVLESSLEQLQIRRRLYIPKMRGTNHALNCYDFYITPEGISISNAPAREP